MKKIFGLCLMIIFSVYSFAAENKKADVEKALKLTQEMLKDPEARKAHADKTPQGQAAAAKVKELAGSSENEQAIYELAASVFGSMVEQTGGDTEKMQKMLNEGLQNPEAFASKWSPEQLQKLNRVSESVEHKVGPSKVIERSIKK